MSPRVSKAKQKAEPKREVLIVVSKEDAMSSAPARARMSEIMLMLAAEWTGGKYHDGKFTYVFRGELPKGDVRWALDEVFKKHDLYNVPSRTASQRLASVLAEELKALPEAGEMFGTAVIATMLDRVYARYDIIGEEDGSE